MNSAARTAGVLTDQIERMKRAGLGQYARALAVQRDVLMAGIGRSEEQLEPVHGVTARQAAGAFPHFGMTT
jgi:hypothetical protein